MDEFRRKQVVEAAKLLCVALLDFQDKGAVDDLTPLRLMQMLPEDTRVAGAECWILSLPADVAEDTCRLAFKGAGWPAPVLMESFLTDARHWVSQANKAEKDGMSMALVEDMSPERLKRYAKYVAGKAADA